VVLVYLVIALGAWLGLNLTVFLLLYARSHRVPRQVRAKTEATFLNPLRLRSLHSPSEARSYSRLGSS
jgi:hypothetical protein